MGSMTTTLEKKSDLAMSNVSKLANAEDPKFRGSMKNLLVGYDETMEDKIATIKTAQLVDNGRFETAFKTLMKR